VIYSRVEEDVFVRLVTYAAERVSLSLCVCVCRFAPCWSSCVSVYVLSSHSRKKEINSVRHLDLQYEATRARINRQARLNMAV
jgi:hypothetical protein